jgi:outer membrane lipoprotein carrier protein
MMARLRPLLLCLLAFPALACAAGLERLESFVKTVHSGRAEFVQVVTPVSREGQVTRARTSAGTFEFLRPGRFRFSYRKPFAQVLVADGQTLWMHDVDLNQVTARKQEAVLASTPAALIASAPDLKALQVDFALSEEPERDGLEWVLATPRARDSSLQSVRLGWRGALPAVLEIMDSFGQKSVISFSGFQANAALTAASFHFTPPPGADVLRP